MKADQMGIVPFLEDRLEQELNYTRILIQIHKPETNKLEELIQVEDQVVAGCREVQVMIEIIKSKEHKGKGLILSKQDQGKVR